MSTCPLDFVDYIIKTGLGMGHRHAASTTMTDPNMRSHPHCKGPGITAPTDAN